MAGRNYHLALFTAVAAVFVWSMAHPYDRFTWLLEVGPALIAVPILLLTYDRFRLTNLVYTLIAVHAVILMVGGHFTYARVPLFDWIRDGFGLARNHYDRVGHFAQGFVPALITREVLLRTTRLERGKMLFLLALSVCLAVSAAYELVEWAVAEVTGEAAADFLGTQGDPWDTQKDMALAGMGAMCSQLLLSGVHDRQLDGRTAAGSG
ncbi:MAG: DUF2238 domain-containing protein [Acidobacteria bacterium]|nr:DUF2238 domain-containing protein [Acidobacteriota bacterium]